MVSPLENVPDSDSDGDGVLDTTFGRTDEATSGVVSGVTDGRWFMAGDSDAGVLDHVLGSVDESLASGTVDDVIDTAFVGHAGDEIDVLGPTVGRAASTVSDLLTTRTGESGRRRDAADDPWWFGVLPWALGGVAVLYVLSVLAPYVEAVAGEG